MQACVSPPNPTPPPPFFFKSRCRRKRLEVILAGFWLLKKDGSVLERVKDLEAKVIISPFLLMRTKTGIGTKENLFF